MNANFLWKVKVFFEEPWWYDYIFESLSECTILKPLKDIDIMSLNVPSVSYIRILLDIVCSYASFRRLCEYRCDVFIDSKYICQKKPIYFWPN